MKSRVVRSFRKAFQKLPKSVQRQARASYRQFLRDPNHPGLEWKLIRPKTQVYSVRIGVHYRALGVRDNEEIVWFWIGSHAEYDKVIEKL
jgi:mRNA-degrading endonuclease RelE of RelBE toxin-antitoxin system